MSFKTSFSKMLSYIARCDPYSNPFSYYVPYLTEENDNHANANNDPKI